MNTISEPIEFVEPSLSSGDIRQIAHLDTGNMLVGEGWVWDMLGKPLGERPRVYVYVEPEPGEAHGFIVGLQSREDLKEYAGRISFAWAPVSTVYSMKWGSSAMNTVSRVGRGRLLYSDLIEPAPSRFVNEGRDYREWAYRADEWASVTLPVSLPPLYQDSDICTACWGVRPEEGVVMVADDPEVCTCSPS